MIYHDFCPKIRGFVVECDDAYTIVLNSRCSYDTNRKTYLHEQCHIDNEDTRSLLSADEIEAVRHG